MTWEGLVYYAIDETMIILKESSKRIK